MQPHAGSVLAGLRSARAVSQTRLAERAGVGRATIQKAEAAEHWRLTSSSTRAVIGVLKSCAALTERERSDLKKILHPELYDRLDTGESLAERVGAESGPAFDRALKRFRTLVQTVGAERVADTLEAIERLTKENETGAPETPENRP